MNDIDLSGYSSGEGWNPIGNYISISDRTKSFRGNFCGNCKVIKNLTINYSSTSFIGLFGVSSGATIKNLGIENGNLIGNGLTGGLVGYNERNVIFIVILQKYSFIY